MHDRLDVNTYDKLDYDALLELLVDNQTIYTLRLTVGVITNVTFPRKLLRRIKNIRELILIDHSGEINYGLSELFTLQILQVSCHLDSFFVELAEYLRSDNCRLQKLIFKQPYTANTEHQMIMIAYAANTEHQMIMIADAICHNKSLTKLSVAWDSLKYFSVLKNRNLPIDVECLSQIDMLSDMNMLSDLNINGLRMMSYEERAELSNDVKNSIIYYVSKGLKKLIFSRINIDTQFIEILFNAAVITDKLEVLTIFDSEINVDETCAMATYLKKLTRLRKLNLTNSNKLDYISLVNALRENDTLEILMASAIIFSDDDNSICMLEYLTQNCHIRQAIINVTLNNQTIDLICKLISTNNIMQKLTIRINTVLSIPDAILIASAIESNYKLTSCYLVFSGCRYNCHWKMFLERNEQLLRETRFAKTKVARRSNYC